MDFYMSYQYFQQSLKRLMLYLDYMRGTTNTLRKNLRDRDWERNFTVWGNPPSVRNSMGDF